MIALPLAPAAGAADGVVWRSRIGPPAPVAVSCIAVASAAVTDGIWADALPQTKPKISVAMAGQTIGATLRANERGIKRDMGMRWPPGE